MSVHRIKRPIAVAVAAVFLLAACATNPDGSYAFDEKATGALFGAAAGCALGAAAKGKQGCFVGAAVGAAAGYLIGWYFESRKIADAGQINAEYERQYKAKDQGKAETVPRNDVVPVKFDSTVTTVAGKSGEKEVQVTSNTDLIGYGDKVPELQQKYAIYDEKNNVVEEKVETLGAVDGAGRYQTSSKFKLPADAKGRKYTVKTALLVNEQPYKESTYKITVVDGQPLRLALLY